MEMNHGAFGYRPVPKYQEGAVTFIKLSDTKGRVITSGSPYVKVGQIIDLYSDWTYPVIGTY